MISICEANNNPDWTRYCITDDGQFWTGSEWSQHLKDALLFCDKDSVFNKYKELCKEKNKCLPIKEFEAIFKIKISGNYDIEVIKEFVGEALKLTIEKTSMVELNDKIQMELDMATLKEVKSQLLTDKSAGLLN
jgi:hypothetical protein